MSGEWVVLRERMGAEDVHYGGNLVAGATMLRLFGDLVTQIAIEQDGDEGLLAGYEMVEFLAPVYGGDFIEARARLVRLGETSRKCEFEARKLAQLRADISDSAAEMLVEPVVVCRAVGTTVVRKERQRPLGARP
ncbi:3-aminobutyryl-CoA ammonia lyase [bacterium]|nr:MAG: 3-aminobutyryl-CoA ammonia lyase [bacterium]